MPGCQGRHTSIVLRLPVPVVFIQTTSSNDAQTLKQGITLGDAIHAPLSSTRHRRTRCHVVWLQRRSVTPTPRRRWGRQLRRGTEMSIAKRNTNIVTGGILCVCGVEIARSSIFIEVRHTAQHGDFSTIQDKRHTPARKYCEVGRARMRSLGVYELLVNILLNSG